MYNTCILLILYTYITIIYYYYYCYYSYYCYYIVIVVNSFDEMSFSTWHLGSRPGLSPLCLLPLQWYSDHLFLWRCLLWQWFTIFLGPHLGWEWTGPDRLGSSLAFPVGSGIRNARFKDLRSGTRVLTDPFFQQPMVHQIHPSWHFSKASRLVWLLAYYPTIQTWLNPPSIRDIGSHFNCALSRRLSDGFLSHKWGWVWNLFFFVKKKGLRAPGAQMVDDATRKLLKTLLWCN